MTHAESDSPDGSAGVPAEWSPRSISGLIHELRTPLASLLVSAELLAEDSRLGERQARLARSLHDAAADLRALIDDLGELNRIRGGRVEPSPVPVDAVRLLEDLASATKAQLADGIALATAIDPGLPGEVRADRPRLLRALRELVLSAAKGGARRIDVRAAATAGASRVVFTVSDDGERLDAAGVESLCEPFALAHARTRRAHGGMGLGPSLARAIARLLGGDVVVASDETGTRATLSLPLE
jgi:signal transduction histidine kinase